MPIINISGIDINFPFEPYDVQKAYMRKVIECLQTGSNGILESPTGTGKTLCLLCASGAWLNMRKAQIQASMLNKGEEENPFVDELQANLNDVVGSGWANGTPKIIYTSRTHAQLTQAIQQLTKTSYNYLKVTVLGSRNQLCIHPEVKAESNKSTQISLCRAKVRTNTCTFHTKVATCEADVTRRKENWLMDIEDLASLGKKERFCPYYMAREMKKSADIIFMPYNYILDPKTRKAQNLDLADTVVIMDEAHNIENVCENTASSQLRSQDIAACISEVTDIMRVVQDQEKKPFAADGTSEIGFDRSLTELAFLKTLLCELEEQVEAIVLPTDGFVRNGSFIFELLEKVEINSEKLNIVVELVESIVEYMNATAHSGPFQRRGNGLQRLLEFLEVVFNKDVPVSQQKESAAKHYKVHVVLEEPKNSGKVDVWSTSSSKLKQRTINYWCFAPGFSMKSLSGLKTRSIIITSGTLHPLETVASELQVPFPVRLENPHVIGDHQVWAGVIAKGPDNHRLNSSYTNRNAALYNSLGRTIIHMARLVPDGVLVFFTSYSVMRSCHQLWEENGVWEQLGQRKVVLMESQSSEEFNSTLEEYYKAINDASNKGAILLAVFRGKVSEGMDFIDTNGRAVIITGLPYAQLQDPRVRLKKEYLDERRALNQEKTLSGREWYNLEATRAINQAIGRVIRHKDDYGAIILCDERFSYPAIQQHLSKWVSPYLKKYEEFGAVVRGLKQFFKFAAETLPQPAGKHSDSGTTVVTDYAAAMMETASGYVVEPAAGFVFNNKAKENLAGSRFHLAAKKVQPKQFINGRDEEEDVSLTVSYFPTDFSSGAGRGTKNDRSAFGCLDALENSSAGSSSPIDIMQRVEQPATSNSREWLSVTHSQKKRRIVIKERNETDTESTASDSSVKEKNNPHMLAVRKYISKVKQSLNAEEYNHFASTLKSFMLDNAAFDDVFNLVVRLFSGKPSTRPLLYDFRMVLKTDKHKHLFEDKISKLKME